MAKKKAKIKHITKNWEFEYTPDKQQIDEIVCTFVVKVENMKADSPDKFRIVGDMKQVIDKFQEDYENS